MTPSELTILLSRETRRVCNHLLPAGVEHKGEWLIGSTSGESGKSMRIRLEGDKAGLWIDFASGERGDITKLWLSVRNLNYKEGIKEIKEFLGIPDEEGEKETSQTWLQLQREMGTGTEHDIRAVQSLRKLPTDAGLRLALENNHLFFGPVLDGRKGEQWKKYDAWVVTDASRRSAQSRRLDGEPWADGQKAKTIHGTTGRWPIGIAECALPEIAFTEGGPDFLAAYTAVAMLGLEDRIQPVALFGSGQVIHPDALPLFRDKTIWMFPHSDDNYAGLQGAIRWEKQLATVNALVIPFDFSAYPGVKDLNDFISAIKETA